MTRAIVAPAALCSGEHVLDAGCGVGGAARLLARERGVSVLGVTISPAQVARAAALNRAAGLEDLVSVELGDCSRMLPGGDGEADAILAIESACHFADRPRFLAEAHRTLRPGGMLVLSDWVATGPAFDPQLSPFCDAWSLAPLDSLESWPARLADAGFEVVEAQDLRPFVLENARRMLRAGLGLRLEAGRALPSPDARRWLAMYETFGHGLLGGLFTVARWAARRG